MAAVTSVAASSPPSGPRGRDRRRWWLAATVVAWAGVLAGLALWSVRHSPPTVPEQRTLQQALPVLQRATGAVFAAAGGPGRAVVLGDLKVTRDCRITPVRSGVVASREVTVYVRAGEGHADLQTIAAGLPKGYRPQVSTQEGGTRFGLHADAGSFIGIDADADAGDAALVLSVSSGCRPLSSAAIDRADPVGGPAPKALGAALRSLGVAGEHDEHSEVVACPGGGTAGTYTVDGVAPTVKPADALKALMAAGGGAGDAVQSGTGLWAYRNGVDSVVVRQQDGGRLKVEATSACQ
jgi:hypothetical protein